MWDFIEGKLFVLVALEVDRLQEIAADIGLTAIYDEERDPDYPLAFELEEGLGLSGVSKQMIGRIGLECVSPETLIHSAVEMYRGSALEFEAEGLDKTEATSR